MAAVTSFRVSRHWIAVCATVFDPPFIISASVPEIVEIFMVLSMLRWPTRRLFLFRQIELLLSRRSFLFKAKIELVSYEMSCY